MGGPTLAVSRLPKGWHRRFLTATRQNRHDVVKWPRFRQVGLSAMLGAVRTRPPTRLIHHDGRMRGMWRGGWWVAWHTNVDA